MKDDNNSTLHSRDEVSEFAEIIINTVREPLALDQRFRGGLSQPFIYVDGLLAFKPEAVRIIR